MTLCVALCLIVFAPSALAFHRPSTSTEVGGSTQQVDLRTSEVTVDLEVTYEYPTLVPTTEPTTTSVAVGAKAPLSAEPTPSRIEHPTDDPTERSPSGANQANTVPLELNLSVPEGTGEGSRTLTVYANTSGTRTLASSQAQFNLTVAWGGDDTGSGSLTTASAEDDARDQDTPQDARGTDSRESTPAPGLLVGLACLTVAAWSLRRTKTT